MVGEGRRVWATQSWDDNWTNVIARVLFKDTVLLDMMMIPQEDRNNVVKFIKKYFVRDVMPDTLIIDENVRVVYSDGEGSPMNIPQVRRRYMAFDVYVKHEFLNNYDNNRLKDRCILIARRIRYLLTRNRNVEGLTFTAVDNFDLGTKVVGYTRHHLIMEYKKTY